MDTPKEHFKQKNSNWSILLIGFNMVLLLIFLNIEEVSENQQAINWVYLSTGLTVLLGGYAFSYHGKEYRLGKWLFGIALLIALIIIGLLWYVMQLGKAFSH